jgi:glyoxylase-like metal-dependent hydrolase (beta-lactamase superfamily II)
MAQSRIKVGDVTVTAVSDGSLKSSLDVIVGLSPDECARLAGCAYDAPVWLPVNAFLVDFPGRRVLVDAGSGTNMQPTLGELPAKLRAIGAAPESIDTILLTHLHPDHANGLIDAEGKANFPDADLILHQQESRFYLERDANDGDNERVRRTLVQSKQATAPYRGRIRTVPDGEAMPGMTALLQPGHTPGHTCWLLQSGGERLLIWGDIVHLPSVQVPRPDTALVFDVDPALARQSRAKVFDWVARERIRVAGAHLPFPGFAMIEQSGGGYSYKPLSSSSV